MPFRFRDWFAVFLSVFIAVVPVKVFAGSMTLLGAGRVVGASGPPVASFVSVTVATNSGSTVTASGVDIGNPAYIATRRVIVMIVGGGAASHTLVQASCLINGIVPDTVANIGTVGANNTNGVWMMSAVVTSGTTGVSLTAEFTGSTFGIASLGVYTVDNSLLVSPTPVTGATLTASTTTGSTTVNSLSGGFILAGLAASSGTSAQAITASTETYTTDAANTGTGRNAFAHANGVATVTGSSIAWSWTGAAIDVVALAAFR